MQAKVDSYKVKQYEDLRFVDTVTVLEIQGKYALCYSPTYRADVLIPRKELFLLKGGAHGKS